MKIVVALLVLMSACAGLEKADTNNTSSDANLNKTPEAAKLACPRPKITLKSGLWLSQDEEMLFSFERGCMKHYSKFHCPLAVSKTGTLSYKVVCGRM